LSFTPHITPWKGTVPIEIGYPDTWPGWTSPDIFVDNTGSRIESSSTAPHTTGPFEYWTNVDLPGEPTLGSATNRLFVVVKNTGTSGGTLQVSVGFTPYAMVGGVWTQFQYKLISQFPLTLPAAGTPSSEQQAEVQWDLSDLTDTNGGLWPLPLGAFNHFCVQVQLTPGNGAQSNFSNVISASPFPIVPILVANSDPEPKTFEIVATLPERWALRLRGLEHARDDTDKDRDKDRENEGVKREDKALSSDARVKFTLDAGEERLVTLSIVRPEGHQKEPQHLTLGLIADGKLVGGLTLKAGPAPRPKRQAARPCCGSPILQHYPLPVFFPKKEGVLRFPAQLAPAGTIVARIMEQAK
jgi:hypothetical protein